MKINLISNAGIVLTFALLACGKPTESRAHMDKIANRTSDSLQILVDSLLEEPWRVMATGPQHTNTYIFEYK
ncbi:MAG TPA: hypothetical protein PLC65_07975 [Bacteroidia bacterium]|nr:hypothetical protein [Bacteroidia bacterium]